MKKIILITVAAAICTVAFAKHHKQKKHLPPQSEIISVNMHRTACFGRCPDYTIDINKDGTITYTAIRFTPDTGVFTKNIGPKALALLNQFGTYRADTCKNGYTSRMQDAPGLNYTIQYKDSVKQVFNAQFGPPWLQQLATTIDAECKKTNDDGWQKVVTGK